MPADNVVDAVILAAGKGTRMKSDLAKVLHRAAGRTLLDWVLESVGATGADRTVVVVGHQADAVRSALPTQAEAVVQEPQNGTGHAVAVALDHLGAAPANSTVLVAYGDMPLVSPAVYANLAARPAEVAVRMVTADPGPDGFGRIIRDESGAVTGIVEERDCTPDQLAITERNAGLYAFDGATLRTAVKELRPDNAQGELYLTDVIESIVAGGGRVETVPAGATEVMGVNSHADLAAVQSHLRGRINAGLLDEGVWMLDPDRTYIDATVTVAAGARIYPGTYLEGATTIGPGATVGPDVLAVDTSIGAGATVTHSVVRQAEIGDGALVGPYASLRPGTVMAPRAKAGTFVEMKNAAIGEGAKVPHLSYMGDVSVGQGSNIGAGTITCNYDGFEKHQTVIGEGVFVGSDTMLVAPVTLGDGAVTAAGSAIYEDVSPGALAIERSAQREVPDYAERRAKRRIAKDGSKEAREGN